MRRRGRRRRRRGGSSLRCCCLSSPAPAAAAPAPLLVERQGRERAPPTKSKEKDPPRRAPERGPAETPHLCAVARRRQRRGARGRVNEGDLGGWRSGEKGENGKKRRRREMKKKNGKSKRKMKKMEEKNPLFFLPMLKKKKKKKTHRRRSRLAASGLPSRRSPRGLDHLERARLDDVELRGGAAMGGGEGSGRTRQRRRGRGAAGKRRERGRRRRGRESATPLRFRGGVPLPRQDVPRFQADDVGRAGRCGRRRGALGPREQQEREQAPLDEGEVFGVGLPGRGRRQRRR